MSLKPLRDEVFLLLPSALQKSITTPSGVTIHLPETLAQEEHAQVEAVVYAVGPTSELGISPGDRVAISYMVTADRQQNEHGDTKNFWRCHAIGEDVVWVAHNSEIFAVQRPVYDSEGQALCINELPQVSAAEVLRMLAESPPVVTAPPTTWVAVGDNVLLDIISDVDAEALAMMSRLGLEMTESMKKGERRANVGRHLSGCTVAEDDTTPLPPGAEIHYQPGLGADYLFPDGKERIVTQRQYCTMYARP